MKNILGNAAKTKLLLSTVAFFLSFSLFSMVAFAWFTLNDTTNTEGFLVEVGEVEISYQLYSYKDSLTLGNTDVNPLINECLPDGDFCYLKVNTISSFGEVSPVIPGDKFSFALEVTNIGVKSISLDASFLGITSLYSDETIPINKIEDVFKYEVTKISIDDPAIDVKSVAPITHYSKYLNNEKLELTNDVILSSFSKTTIFFNIYYDPIFGDANSNIYEKQILTITHLLINMKNL